MVIVLLDSKENMALPYFMLYQVDKNLLLVPESFLESWPSGAGLSDKPLNFLSTSILKFGLILHCLHCWFGKIHYATKLSMNTWHWTVFVHRWRYTKREGWVSISFLDFNDGFFVLTSFIRVLDWEVIEKLVKSVKISKCKHWIWLAAISRIKFVIRRKLNLKSLKTIQ